MLIMHVWTTSFPWYGNSYHGGEGPGDAVRFGSCERSELRLRLRAQAQAEPAGAPQTTADGAAAPEALLAVTR